MNAADTVATVWAVGDRSDQECYAIAARRLTATGDQSPLATSLAAVMLQLSRERRR